MELSRYPVHASRVFCSPPKVRHHHNNRNRVNPFSSTVSHRDPADSELITDHDSQSTSTMSEESATPVCDGAFDRQRLADCLVGAAQQLRLQGQQFGNILSATDQMERDMEEF